MRAAFPIRSERERGFDPQSRGEGSAGIESATEWRALAAGVAHEIRNPLAAVSNAVSLLRRSSQLDPEGRELIDMVLHEVRRVDRLVQDLLESAAPAADVWAPTSIGELLERTVALLSKDCGSGVRLESQLDPALPTVVAQTDRIEQVIWNLLRNAVEAAGARGRIRVEARCLERNGRRGVRVAVCDDGPGIPPALRRRVFEPFFTSKHDGHGLGLPLCKRIVERHQGAIGADSATAAGSGACVWFWLPEHPAAEEND